MRASASNLASHPDVVVIGGDAAAFAAGHVLVVIEAEAADVADTGELATLVAAADTLAGVLASLPNIERRIPGLFWWAGKNRYAQSIRRSQHKASVQS